MKKSPLRKRAKTKTNAWYRKQAVEIAKKISKHIDNYTCVTCGRSAEQGWQMHGSHILPESRYLRLSVEPENIMCQCAKCHMIWHESPKEQNWFEEKYPERLKRLRGMEAEFQKQIIKPDYNVIYQELKSELNQLIKY